jgi:hypothetical protein
VIRTVLLTACHVDHGNSHQTRRRPFRMKRNLQMQHVYHVYNAEEPTWRLDQCDGLVSASDQTIAVRATAGDAGWQGSFTPPSSTKRKGSGVGPNRSAGLGGIRVDDRPRHAASEHIFACHPVVDQRARGNSQVLGCCTTYRTTGIPVAISERVCIERRKPGKRVCTVLHA